MATLKKARDDESRIGPMRAMQSGDISEPENEKSDYAFQCTIIYCRIGAHLDR